MGKGIPNLLRYWKNNKWKCLAHSSQLVNFIIKYKIGKWNIAYFKKLHYNEIHERNQDDMEKYTLETAVKKTVPCAFYKNGLLPTICSLYFYWLAIVVSLYHLANHSCVPGFRIAINYVLLNLTTAIKHYY